MRLTTPTIETERLILREITPVTIDILLKQFSRAELQEYLDIETEEALNNEIRKLSGAIETQRFSFKIWYLVEKSSNRVIGDVAYHVWFVMHQRAEIGYALRKEKYKRKGYMSEAVAAVLQHGFEEMKLQRIEACISPINIASLQLVRKFGFQQEGYLRHHYHNRTTHEVDDSLMFSLILQDYRALQDEPLALKTLMMQFEQRCLPAKYWTHEAHLSVAIWYLSYFNKIEATCWLRSGIIAYNVASGRENTPSSGYHETITLFWIDIIHEFLKTLNPNLSVEEKIAQFLASPQSHKALPFRYYTKKRLLSTEARAVWLAPDLKSL